MSPYGVYCTAGLDQKSVECYYNFVKYKHISRQIKKISVNLILFLIKLLILLKRLLAAFFISLIYRPGRLVSRFVFYKFIVKFYSAYLSFLKKLGWRGFKDSPLLFLIKQKLGHIAVIIVTILLVYTNLVSRTKAENFTDLAGKTILANLIEGEFANAEEERLIEEFFDEEAVISPTQYSYLDNLAVVKSRPVVKMEDLGRESGDNQGAITLGSQALKKPDIVLTKKTKQPRTGTIVYTVKTGDTVSTIAERFAVSVNTILWENNLSAYSVIRPGDKLAILPESGVTHKVVSGDNLTKIAAKYKVEKAEIMAANKMTDASRLSVGQKLFIPGGRKTVYARRSASRYSGLSAIKDLVKTPNAKPVAGNKMNWPTKGHRITQYYSWRHRAVDIANRTGTPIYAADAGTVEYAGWSKGYGNNIVINHGGGKKTRYAHASKLYVKRGQKVSKGETIAAMGSTGWSTGPHVHFEVIINGRKYNPLNYIK